MRSLKAVLAPALLASAVAAGPALATAQVAGPVQIGPSWGQGDPQHSAALLSTVIANHGDLPDRLIRVDCPNAGQASLRNATLHPDIQVPTLDQQQAALAEQRNPNGPRPQQNGLDLPAREHGAIRPVTALIDLAQASQTLADGALVPCSLYFAHAGQRIVVFTIGEQPTPTSEP